MSSVGDDTGRRAVLVSAPTLPLLLVRLNDPALIGEQTATLVLTYLPLTLVQFQVIPPQHQFGEWQAVALYETELYRREEVRG